MENPSDPFPISMDDVTQARPSHLQPPLGQRDSQTIPIGTRLADTYLIESFVGRGGMGEVYRARDPLNELVAIKVILPSRAQDPEVIRGFEAEARKLKRVQADAVVRYYGFFKPTGQRPFLVMELVEGCSLAERVARKGRLSVQEVRQLRERLASGLKIVHDRGTFHRDLSPDNIILVEDRADLAKVIDFGIARSVEVEGTVLGDDFGGKLSWVAPEQLGLPTKEAAVIDARTDIYSLGLVLAFAAAGKKILHCETFAEAIQSRMKLPDLSAVPEALRAELIPLVEPDPMRRPATMQHLAGQHKLATANAVPLGGNQRQTVASASKRKSPWILAGSVAAAVALGLGGLYGWSFLNQHGSPAPTPPPPNIAGSPQGPSSPPNLDPFLGNMRLAAQRLDCAKVSIDQDGPSSIRIMGFVASDADRQSLRSAAAAPGQALDIHDQALEISNHPSCDVRLLLAGIPDNGLQISPDSDHIEGVYELGEPIRITIDTPKALSGWVSVDLFDAQGKVGHMLPQSGSDNYLTPEHALKVGWPTGKTRIWPAQGPPGPVTVLVITRNKPPPYPANPVEDAKTYIGRLNQTLNDEESNIVAASYATIQTVSAPPK